MVAVYIGDTSEIKLGVSAVDMIKEHIRLKELSNQSKTVREDGDER